MMDKKDSQDDSRLPENGEKTIAALQSLSSILSAQLPQPELLERASALFKRRLAQPQRRNQLPSTLKFDSWANGIPAGARKGMLPNRQLLFEAGQLEADLQLIQQPDEPLISIQGQLMAEVDDLTGIELQLADSNGNARSRMTNQFGEFHFSLCEPADYTLTVLIEDAVLVSHFTIPQPMT